MLVKKVTYFGYLNSSYYLKIFLSSLRDNSHAFVAKLSDTCFCWFPATIFLPPYWCPSGWEPKKICCDLNVDESLCIFTFFLFPDSGLNLLNNFVSYFDLF